MSYEKDTNQKLIVITGPTASGKTELAIKAALFINKKVKKYAGAEIISVDSRQIYKNLEIGANYPTTSQLKIIPHHLIGTKSVKQKMSVVQFQKMAIQIINKLWKKSKIPILCGGNLFYIQAIIDGINFPSVPPNSKLRKMLEKKDLPELLNILKKLDLSRWKKIDQKNKRRIIRAIEIASALGKVPPFQKNPLPAQTIIFAINIPKENLKEKIKKRAKLMVKRGIIEETKNLLKLKVSLQRIRELGFEYKNVLDYLEGKIKTKKELAEKISQDTMHYVKKQLTWLKKEKRIIWVNNKEDVLKKIKDFLA